MEDQAVTKTIASGEQHAYTMKLKKGMAVLGQLMQEGIDLVVDLYSSDGYLIRQVDSSKDSKPVMEESRFGAFNMDVILGLFFLDEMKGYFIC